MTLAGDRMTIWTGLAVTAERIDVGAGPRGILQFAWEGDRASAHDVGGDCLGLVGAEGRLFALVAPPSQRSAPREIVVLRPDGDRLLELRRLPVDFPLDLLRR
jgi:hypothetical protein